MNISKENSKINNKVIVPNPTMDWDSEKAEEYYEEYTPSQTPNVPRCCTPPSMGWVEMRLDKSDMDCLWKYIETAKKENVNINSQLAGNISSSLQLIDTDNFFNKVLDPLCGQYHTMFGGTPNLKVVGKNFHPIELTDMWVNFQKKHEFNPPHDHTGLYSFVIFMKIPTNYKDQKKLSIASNSNSDAISNFSFLYTNMFGKLTNHPLRMSSEYEGIILLFPSSLVHSVHPFYESDETRITISGNISLNTKIILDRNTGNVKKAERQPLFHDFNKGIDSPYSPQEPKEKTLFSGL